MSQLKDWQAGTSNDPYVIGSSGSLTLNQGTANGVAYLNGSKVVTSGSALTFDGTNLGIGGASAGAALSVTKAKATAQFTSSTGTNGTYIAFSNTGGNNYVGSDSSTGSEFLGAPYSLNLVTGGAYPILFGIGNTEQMRLTSTGLGIGTSSPSRKLEVHGTPATIGGAGTGVLATFVNNSTAYNASPTSAISLWNKINSGGSTFPSAVLQAGKENATDGNYAGYMSFITINSGGDPYERMRLDSVGNLGLGVTPSAWSGLKAFEIAGTGSSLSSASNNNMFLSANAWYNGTNWRYGITAAASQYQSFSGQHAWYTAPSGTAGNAITFTQALTLDSSGNLLVGQTSNPAVGRIAVTFAGNTTNGLELKDSTDTASAAYISFRNAAGSGTGSVTRGSGNTVLYNVSSDQRLKDNIQDADSASSLIDSLQVRKFDWKKDQTHQRYGFVAQELVQVAPEAVHQPEDTEQMMAVDYSKLVPMLVKEIQSLRKRLADAGIA
jgi:hypothetical protein